MNPTRSDDELDWEEAMELWRDDTRRRASRIRPAVLTDRILRLSSADHRRTLRDETASLRYAAAALLLIGLGLGGSLWLGARAAPTAGAVPDTLRAVERGRLLLEGDRAAQDFDVAAARAAGEER